MPPGHEGNRVEVLCRGPGGDHDLAGLQIANSDGQASVALFQNRPVELRLRRLKLERDHGARFGADAQRFLGELLVIRKTSGELGGFRCREAHAALLRGLSSRWRSCRMALPRKYWTLGSLQRSALAI